MIGGAVFSEEDALNARATRDVDSITAPIDFDGHILNGEVKRNGDVVGGHSIASGNVRVIPGTQSPPNTHGVYTAQIEVPDPLNPGKFLQKTNNGGVSTLFPDSWTADRVKVEVDAAFQNKVITGNKWAGVTPSGVRVEGWMKPKATVYPKY
ncbi:EndoU domain-containing protein [Vreelandella sp. GE22]